MKLEMGDWKPAVDKLVARMEGGSWRHGLKTDDAVREVVRYGGFPADLDTMWTAKWKRKNGDLLKFALYYLVQKSLKNRRSQLKGASGQVYRLRSFYNVKHGVAQGECDDDGVPLTPDKKGLWLHRDDMNAIDVEQARVVYRNRETDASADKRWLGAAAEALRRRPQDVTCGDVRDEITAAM